MAATRETALLPARSILRWRFFGVGRRAASDLKMGEKLRHIQKGGDGTGVDLESFFFAERSQMVLTSGAREVQKFLECYLCSEVESTSSMKQEKVLLLQMSKSEAFHNHSKNSKGPFTRFLDSDILL